MTALSMSTEILHSLLLWGLVDSLLLLTTALLG